MTTNLALTLTRGGALLQHWSTTDSARALDLVRQRLGQAKLDDLGLTAKWTAFLARVKRAPIDAGGRRYTYAAVLNLVGGGDLDSVAIWPHLPEVRQQGWLAGCQNLAPFASVAPATR